MNFGFRCFCRRPHFACSPSFRCKTSDISQAAGKNGSWLRVRKVCVARLPYCRHRYCALLDRKISISTWTFSKKNWNLGTFLSRHSAKQQREMTKFCVFWRTWRAMPNFSYLSLELNAVITLQQVLRPIVSDYNNQQRGIPVRWVTSF